MIVILTFSQSHPPLKHCLIEKTEINYCNTPYNDDSSSFYAVPITFSENSAETLAQAGIVNGHGIVTHFHHR